jgi:hypothetical protein
MINNIDYNESQNFEANATTSDTHFLNFLSLQMLLNLYSKSIRDMLC